MDREDSIVASSPLIIRAGWRYEVCRECVRRGTGERLPDCEPPTFKRFKPWYKCYFSI